MALPDLIENDTLLTTGQAGDLLQVHMTSVIDWIKKGILRGTQTPRGHRRVQASDLVAFLIARNVPIPNELEGISRRRVLIVDDNPMELKAMERLARGYADRLEVETVDNGIHALIRVGEFKPHLIVLDVIAHSRQRRR